MLNIILDGNLMTDRNATHDLLAESFHFPDYYGRNLDAFYDLLSAYPEEIHVIVIHEQQMFSVLGKYGQLLLKTLQDGAAVNAKIKLSIFSEKNENNS